MRIFQLALAVLLSLVCYGAATPEAEVNVEVVIINEMMTSGFSMTSLNKMDEMNNKTKETELFKLCKELRRLEEIVIIIANVTLLEEFETKHNLTADQITQLKAEAQNATAQLDMLKSNATLVEECLILEAHLMLLRECRRIRELIIIIEISKNETLLIEIEKEIGKNLTATQVTELQVFATNATTELVVFEKNTTLITECKTLLNITLDLNTTTTTTTHATTTTTHASTITSTVRLNTTATTTSLRTTSMTSVMTTSSLKPTTTANTTTIKLNTTTTTNTTVKLNVTNTTSASIVRVTTNGGMQNIASTAFIGLLGLLVAALML